MKAHFKSYAQYKFAVEMTYDIVIPQEIRTWLVIKDSPFDNSHIMYTNRNLKSNVIAFEFIDDAYYFIAWMEMLRADMLELPL